MDKEPRFQEEKNIDSAELTVLVENLLQESSKYSEIYNQILNKIFKE